MEAAETLVGVIAPYGSSVWGEKWRRGMTPEEAAEFAALRGQ
jgi:hypothetical protein